MGAVKDSLKIFSGRIAVIIAGALANILIARILGPEGQGIYTLIILLPFLAAKIGDLGIGHANVYFLGKKEHGLQKIANNSFSLAIIIGLLVLVISGFALNFLQPSFFKNVPLAYLRVALLTLPFFLFISYFGMILLGANRINEYNVVQNFLRSLPLLLFLLFFLVILKKGLLGATLAWALTNIIAGAVSIYFVQRLTGIKWAVDFKFCKELIKFGVKGYLATIMNFLNYRLDILLINFFTSAVLVGYYSISVLIAETLLFFPTSIGLALFPRTAQSSRELPYRSTPQICRVSLFLTFISACILFVLSKSIILILFGKQFIPAYQPLKILLPGIAALSVCNILNFDLIGRGKPIFVTYASGVALGINIILNLLFIPRWGISGAALSSTLSYVVMTAIVLKKFLSISENKFLDTVFIKREDFKVIRSKFAKFAEKIHYGK
ncbi:MAG: flippase [bacterium]